MSRAESQTGTEERQHHLHVIAVDTQEMMLADVEVNVTLCLQACTTTAASYLDEFHIKLQRLRVGLCTDGDDGDNLSKLRLLHILP